MQQLACILVCSDVDDDDDVIAAFVFTIAMLILYDRLVERRNEVVYQTAAKQSSDIIVSLVFPEKCTGSAFGIRLLGRWIRNAGTQPAVEVLLGGW